MKRKFAIWGSSFSAFMSVFLLGAYTDSVIFDVQPVELHQWVLVVVLGMLSVLNLIENVNNKK